MTSETRRTIAKQPCLVCQKLPVEIAHVKSSGSGGCDEEFNLMPLCFEHHQLTQHRIGIVTFFQRFPRVRAYLEAKGWELKEIVGRLKLVHEKLEAQYENRISKG